MTNETDTIEPDWKAWFSRLGDGAAAPIVVASFGTRTRAGVGGITNLDPPPVIASEPNE